MADKRFEKGLKMRCAVLGKKYVDQTLANRTPFDTDFQTYITSMAWGDVWTRPGLERKTRHLLTIAMLAALGHERELELHIRSTVNTGVTPDELREALLQVAVYAGVPAANSAVAIAKRIYKELQEGKR